MSSCLQLPNIISYKRFNRIHELINVPIGIYSIYVSKGNKVLFRDTIAQLSVSNQPFIEVLRWGVFCIAFADCSEYYIIYRNTGI